MTELFNEFTSRSYKNTIQGKFMPKTMLNDNFIPRLDDEAPYKATYMMNRLYLRIRYAYRAQLQYMNNYKISDQRRLLVPFEVFRVVS
ncbi:MAG: hypothetical protein LBH02_02200 [Methanocalculaceae archaeon]|nr:hypothetical protein [Methanocalculaceae archaeon]